MSCGRFGLRGPQRQLLVGVDAQNLYCRATGRRFPHKVNSLPLKMIGPRLLAGMKQGDDVASFGIDSSKVWSFVEIAVDAGERKILRIVSSAMFTGNDMLHMQCGEQRVCLPELTILAAILGSPSYRCASRFVHRLWHADMPESFGLSFEN